MKKFLIIISICLIFFTGCGNKKEEKKDINEEEIVSEEPAAPDPEEEKYIDENNTPIGLYLYNYNTNSLELVDEYRTTFVFAQDIELFQIYSSNEKEIVLTEDYANAVHDAWIANSNYQNLKIGFNIKYTKTNGEEVNFNLLDYKFNCEELYFYLYDAYANRFNSWYSHIEEKDMHDDTLFTTIKVYGAVVDNIASKVSLTVFTYDGLDDFDHDGNYRGNSSYTMTICDVNKTCD